MQEREKQVQSMIEMMKKWITAALSSSNYQADFSMESLKDIDRFFDEQNTKDGILSQNEQSRKGILFALGIYVGETIIANYGGRWIAEEYEDPNAIKLQTEDGENWFPVIRVLARYQYGSANSLYAYGKMVNKKKTEEKQTPEKSIDEIWKIEDKQTFVIEMDNYIAKKCEYGDKMQNLNGEQRVFYITQALEREVNNGGFSQFFFNHDGAFANELISSFEKIGAEKTAQICKKAISIYGDTVPEDREAREAVLTTDDENEEERIEAILNECDDAFFEYEEDLIELNYQFIVRNKESFSE